MWGWVLLSATAACGDGAAGLREWTPEDHQPPSAVTPEGQGEGAESGEQAQARAIVALWSVRCATCHGAEGRGDGTGRPPGIAVPDLSASAFQASRSDAQFAEVITNGRGMMPPFGAEITEAGISALIHHVRSLRKNP